MASTIELKKLLFCLLEALDITDPEKVKHIIKISYISNKLLTYLNIDQKESLILGSMYINLLNIKESTFTEENKLLEHNTKGFEDLLHEIKTHHQDLLNLLMDTSKEILDHILKNGSLDKGITKSYLFKPKLKNALNKLIQDPLFIKEINHPLLEQTIYDNLSPITTSYQLQDYENFALFLNIWANEQNPVILAHSLSVGYVSFRLAKCFNLPDETCHRIKIAGLFHNLGKIGIKTNILNQYPNITKEEEVEFESYPYYTFKIIKHLENIKDIVLWATYDHHRLTDTDTNKKALLEIEIQLLAIAELYISYRQNNNGENSLPLEKAINKLSNITEKLFNPSIVNHLKKNLGLVEKSRKEGLTLAKKILNNQFTLSHLQVV